MTSEIKEVARYLKIHFDIPQATENTIKEMLVVAKSLTPQKRVVTFDITHGENSVTLVGTNTLLGANIVLEGKLATKHFAKSNKLIVVLATMGMQSELLLKKYFAESGEKAVVLDACLTAQIEYYLDSIEEELKESTSFSTKTELTTRISCGYGDLALTHQKELLKVVNGNLIGVFLNDSYMLSPNKSVIGLIGIKNETC